MPIRIEVTDENLTYFSEGAREELKNHLENYSMEVIKETDRLEETIRNDSNTPEITRTIVKRAITNYKNSFTPSKKKNKQYLIKTISSLSIFFAGVACDFSSFKTNTVQLIIFLILALIATISTTIMYIREDE
ncbi:hypothetical protein [Clostridium butyricum]